MRKNIIISSFRQIPLGIRILFALFLATELFLNIIRPHITTFFWNKFIVNEHRLIDLPVGFDYLILGDSIQKTGIDPVLVSDNILNLGLPGAKPPSLYLLLSRYLKKHKPPKAVFLFIDPQDVHQAMHLVLKYFVTPAEYRSLWKDLTWDERLHFFLRYWVSLDERLVSAPIKQVYNKPNSVFIREMIQQRGYMPLPQSDVSISDDYFAKTGKRPEKTISTIKRDFVYLGKIIELARANNIKVVLLGNILPKELYDTAEQTGYNMDWLAFLDIIIKAYPDTHLVNEPILYLDNKFFADPSHVNKEGRAIYTEYFKKRVFIPFTAEFETK